MEDVIKENLEKLENNLDKVGGILKAKVKKRLDVENSMLLIVDIQERLSAVMEDEKQIIRNTNILLKACEELGIPVVVTEQYPEGLGSTVEEIRENFPLETKIFDKITFSVLDTKEIKEYITSLNRPNIIIAGMETHICVYQTARDLQGMGYNSYIVRDAVTSRTEDNFQNGLDLMESFGSKITNTETVLYEWLRKAGTEEFKKLSKLIK